MQTVVETMRNSIALLALGVLVLAALIPGAASFAQDPNPADADGPPFSLPFADPPGPNTWLYQQHYGNTTAAFNYGDVWYQYGQGLHFGVDFMAPCGTPVLAIADGVVRFVDAVGFGAGPHNLIVDHPGTGYSSLYGHLRDQPALVQGQSVARGEQVGLSGDPDGSCESRPHLHLEIRSPDFLTAYNPLPFFEENWHMLASVGPYSNPFQQDLDTPYRWMRLDDQPDVAFSARIANQYARPWPRRIEVRAPVNTAPARRLEPLPADATVTRSPVALDAWNLGAWWDPSDDDAVYLIDAVPGQGSGVFRQPLDGSRREYLRRAPPPNLSPDGLIALEAGPDGIQLTRRADDSTWTVRTAGVYPAVSPGGTRLLWEIVHGEIVPGTSDPSVQVWVSALDGSNSRMIYSYSGVYSLWLDDDRVLIVRRIRYTAETRLSIIDLRAAQPEAIPLGAYRYLRGLQIAPGGQRIVFMLPFQVDPAASGIYVQRTTPQSTPRKLPFFGAYQWRDDRSLFTLSYEPDQDAHALGVADVITGEHRALTDPDDLPLRVANGEWAVAPDGERIMYVDPDDYGLYLLAVE